MPASWRRVASVSLVVVVVCATAPASAQAPPPKPGPMEPPENIQKAYETAVRALQLLLGSLVFLLSTVALVELVATRGSRSVGTRLSTRDAGRTRTPREFAVRAAVILVGCWWGVAIYLGGAALWWTAVGTSVGGLLFVLGGRLDST